MGGQQREQCRCSRYSAQGRLGAGAANPTEADIDNQRNSLAEVKAMTEAEFESQHGIYGTRQAHIDEAEKRLITGSKRLEHWSALQKRARELLDDLGGAAEHKDAKLTWEDPCDDEF